VEERHGRAGPAQDPHVHSSSKLRQQLAQRRPFSASEPEVGREEPAGEVDVSGRTLELVRDLRQGASAVDEDLDGVSWSRREGRARPGPGLRVERLCPAEPLQPAAMMPGDDALEPDAERAVEAR
jgi:hypothetical protein